MAYTAFEDMRLKNIDTYKIQTGPIQPYLTTAEGNGNDLKSAALRFIHNQCEKLNFDEKIAENEKNNRVLQGTGTDSGQIPYNMQMDINRLCLERELEHFIDSGVAEDAYNVYYCYLEIFFGRYGKSKKMVELLSEYESNGSSLLMKHRDHYSHSVYVFTLGLAIYETNKNFRKAFKSHYGFSTDETDREQNLQAANMFLEFWGLTALFHDIGYPFELPFEQAISYYEVAGEKRGEGPQKPYLSYRALDMLIHLSDKEQAHFKDCFHKNFYTIEELLAWGISEKLGEVYGFTEGYLLRKIHEKPIYPESFDLYMDHAYFSAVRLYHEIIKDPYDPEKIKPDIIRKEHLDALTAIMLHNSLYKFAIAFYKDDDEKKRKGPLPMDMHPLAYLLMLCDELQCWDRTAYGRNSRTELHPMSVDFDFSNNAITAVYHFDMEEHDKIEEYEQKYEKWVNDGKPPKEEPRLKDYSDMAAPAKRFTGDIERIVDTSQIPLNVTQDLQVVDRSSKHTFLSSSNFLHLYDFAVALNGRYQYKGKEKEYKNKWLEAIFEDLSLEYQLSNINQAKSFGKYLNALGCFFTDKPVDYDMITHFTPEQMEIIAPMEHERWIREHISMGWIYGDAYETLTPEGITFQDKDEEKRFRSALREQFRMHKLTMNGDPTEEDVQEHFKTLSDDDKGKDAEPFNRMLELIKQYDGLRIYQLNDEILEGAAVGKISKSGRGLSGEEIEKIRKELESKEKLSAKGYRSLLQRLIRML